MESLSLYRERVAAMLMTAMDRHRKMAHLQRRFHAWVRAAQGKILRVQRAALVERCAAQSGRLMRLWLAQRALSRWQAMAIRGVGESGRAASEHGMLHLFEGRQGPKPYTRAFSLPSPFAMCSPKTRCGRPRLESRRAH